MAFLIDRELSCCQLDAGLLSISGRPLPGPSPAQTRFPLIPPSPLWQEAATVGEISRWNIKLYISFQSINRARSWEGQGQVLKAKREPHEPRGNAIEVCGSPQRPAGRAEIISLLPDCGHHTESAAKSCSASWHPHLLSSVWHCHQCPGRAGHSTDGINKTYESCNEKGAAGPTEPESIVYWYTQIDSSKAVQCNYSCDRGL